MTDPSKSNDQSQPPFVQKGDIYRIGGPTLSRWPLIQEWCSLEAMPSASPTRQMFWRVQQEIEERMLPFKRMQLVYRHHRFSDKEDHDLTILVYGHLTYITKGDTYEDWAGLIIDCLEYGREIGFEGRVEVLDPVAVNGMSSFRANFSADLLSSFRRCNYQDLLIEEMDLLGQEIPWSVVMPANRGYSFETSQPAVVVKIDQRSESSSFALIKHRFTNALERFRERLNTQSEDDLRVLGDIKVCLVQTDTL